MRTFMSKKQVLIFGVLICSVVSIYAQVISYPIVDTGVHQFYSNTAIISAPAEGAAFYGQDACYQGNEPNYTDNNDGTITDNVTNLMWQKDMGDRISYNNALIKADTLTLANYTDWRMPSIKELYSLIIFTGQSSGENVVSPYINTNYFIQPPGSPRPIDAQTWSKTKYLSLTMNGDSTVFGVNFLDGRIKGYPQYQPGTNNTVPNANLFARMVRGNPYGINDFVDNDNGTITDNTTGLMWQQADDGVVRDWQNSLAYAENLVLAGFDDWRLPNAKELQSIVDYSRCPDITQSAAINPLFSTTSINDPDGNPGQYPYFWTGTTHLDGPNPYTPAVYIAFGEAQGRLNNVLLDVHGAGAQRSDPKTGNPADYPQYVGPQGDVRYVFNYTRCVRNVTPTLNNDETEGIKLFNIYPNPVRSNCTVTLDKTYKSIKINVYNIKGTLIKQYQVSNKDSFKLNLGNLPSGVFILKTAVNGYSESSKVVKL